MWIVHQSLYCSLKALLTPHITVLSQFLVPIAHCILHSLMWLQYQNGGVSCVNSNGVIMRETLPFQYTAKSYPVCSVYSSIGTRNFDMTVLRVMECFYRAQSLRAENVLHVIAVCQSSLCWYGDPVVGGAMVGLIARRVSTEMVRTLHEHWWSLWITNPSSLAVAVFMMACWWACSRDVVSSSFMSLRYIYSTLQ